MKAPAPTFALEPTAATYGDSPSRRPTPFIIHGRGKKTGQQPPEPPPVFPPVDPPPVFPPVDPPPVFPPVQPPIVPPGTAPGTPGAFYHADFAGQVRTERYARPADDEQATAETVALMSRLVIQDAAAPIVRQAAQQAMQGTGNRPTARAIAAAVFAWVKKHVQFREDAQPARGVAGLNPATAEVLIRPADLLNMPMPAGDCDDFSMLTAAMLRALGIRSYFRTIAADPSNPELYSHVFVVAELPEPLAMDTSHGPYPGWAAPAIGKDRNWRPEEMERYAPATLGEIPTWATDLMKIGATAGADIAKMRFGQPPTGTYIQTGPNGATIYRQQPGSGPLDFPAGAGAGTGFALGGSAVLIVVIIAVVILLMKNNSK